MTNIQRLKTMSGAEWEVLFTQSWSISGILLKLGCPTNDRRLRSLVKEAAATYDVEAKNRAWGSYTGKISADALRACVGGAECWADVMRALDVTQCSFTYAKIREMCATHEISTEHFTSGVVRRGKRTFSFDEIFCENSEYSRPALRDAAKRFGIAKEECEQCGAREWQGVQLVIELDHINGVSNDNRLQNLRWLCPNCHSITPTYRNRGR